ncbi:MAG: hypothetical protein OEM21_06855 [Nitrosopumilus sp.]|nr:hypothetical protein [Nitrosopumilus sp.]
MTLQNKNPWKYLSLGLFGVIAIGLLAPAQAAPGGAFSGWQLAVADLQTQIDSIVGGDFQGQIDEVVGDLAAHTSADDDLDSTNEIQNLSETSPGVITLSDDGSVTVQDRVSGTCAAGSSIRAIAVDGTVTCETDTDTNTTYTAGTGLTLSGTTFSADTATLQKRVSGTCAAGSSISAIAADGTVTCETDDVGAILSTYWGTLVDTPVAAGASTGLITASCDEIADLAIGRSLLSVLAGGREPLAIQVDAQGGVDSHNWQVEAVNLGSSAETVRVIPICVDRSP